MISPTGNGTSPSTPTVNSRPGMNCSAMTSVSNAVATSTAASNPSALCTSVIPTEEPIFDGLTITGHPSAVVTSSGATGAMNHARSEEHTSELQSQSNLVCRLLLEKKKNHNKNYQH